MGNAICLACGAEISYDWAPCPECGWKAQDTWGMDEETNPIDANSPGVLSKPQLLISVVAWIILGVLLLGFVFVFWCRY